MKATLTSLLLLSICSLTFGQDKQTDILILLKEFREFKSDARLVYVDTVNKDGHVPEKLKSIIEKEKINDRRSNNSLTLTKAEKKYFLEQIASMTVWDDSLFPDSRRIDDDSLWAYLGQAYKERKQKMDEFTLSHDSLSYDKLRYNYPYVFTFIRPIYLRNNTICFIAWGAMCGGECGHTEQSFYKKENSEWTKWMVISSGEF